MPVRRGALTEWVGDSLQNRTPLWKKRLGGVYQTGGTSPPYRIQEDTKRYRACIPNRREVMPKPDIHIQRILHRILSETSILSIHLRLRKRQRRMDMMRRLPVWN